MNQNLLQFRGISTPLFSLPFFLTAIFFLLPEPALSIDEFFRTCVPVNCGKGPNISYPFWIPGLQPSHCGFPLFKVSCKNNEPILNMSGTDFIIRKIFPDEHILHVVNAGWIGKPCPYAANNLTFSSTPFTINETNLNLLLFFNCTGSVPQKQGPSYFPFSCFSNHSFAVLNSIGSFDYSNLPTNTCMPPISVPVARQSSTLNHGYEELLEKGFLLNYGAPMCGLCLKSGGNCGYNETTSTFACYCEDGSHRGTCDGSPLTVVYKNKNNIKRKIKIGAATGVGVLVLTCFSILLLYAIKKKSWTSIFFWEEREVGSHNVETFLQNYGSFAPMRYKFSDLKKMTHSFIDKLGQGGYGGVFKGKLDDGRLVAVKVLNNSKGSNGEEFINEVASIGRTYHVNVVPLLGFCSEGSKRALIYEYMPNGSLDKFIYSKKQGAAVQILEFDKLFQIAVGIARGLEYLHRGCSIRILHFDIKPHNILLDNDFCPKISDFGMAKLCPNQESTVSMLDARGTIGYTAPELFCRNIGGVSHKSDVYSYGMMVLEMVGGRKNIDACVQNTSEIYFPHWVYNHINLQESLEFLGITTETDEEVARKMILVGLWCIQTDPTNRPSMSRVLEMLEGSLDCLQVPPKPYLSSPTREYQSSSTT